MPWFQEWFTERKKFTEGSPRGRSSWFTEAQLKYLFDRLSENTRPSKETVKNISEHINLSYDQVNVSCMSLGHGTGWGSFFFGSYSFIGNW